MDLIYLGLRFFLGLLFITSAVSKMFNILEHIVIVKEYKVLPERLAKFFTYLSIIIEVIFSTLLLIGFLTKLASSMLLILLIVYTAAIVLNIFRGNTDISCGCGGVLGNHKLSWFLPIRNIGLSILLIGLIYNTASPLFSIDAILTGYNSTEKGFQIFLTMTSSILILISVSNINLLKQINKSLREIQN